MEMYVYDVWFSNGDYEPQRRTAYASCEEDAKILAMAQRIQDGLDRTIISININTED